jgi:hypothetical protein
VLVDQYFDDSTGRDDSSAAWAEKNGFEVVQSPAFNPDDMTVDGPSGSRKRKPAKK